MEKKKNALRILIRHDFLLSPVLHDKLLEKIDMMSEQDIDAIGSFLAEAKKRSIAYNQQVLENIDRLLNDAS